MIMHKKPLLQRQDAAGPGGAPKPRIQKGPLEERKASATDRTRSILRTKKEEVNKRLLDAAGKGFLWDVEKFMKAGAEVNAVDGEGKSVLDLAEESGNPSLVKFLGSKGAKSAK